MLGGHGAIHTINEHVKTFAGHLLTPAQSIRSSRLMCMLHAGSLFALEVLHRTGVQFYEMATFAVLAGQA